jgi:hypothetical protein
VTDPPPIAIQWEAPAECPDAASLRAGIERLLGKRLPTAEGRHVRAEGKIQKTEAGNWELQSVLAVGEHIEQETLIAKRCQALGDAMALKVALAIDPLAVVDAVQPGAEADAMKPSLDSTTPVAVSHPIRRTSAPRPELRVGLRLVGGVGLGPLPSVTPGAGLYASLQLHSVRVELGGEAYWGGVARYAALPDVGADLQLFMGAARSCMTPGAGRWTFPICGGIELGVMLARGFGTDTTTSSSRLWGGVVVGPALQLQMTRRLALWVEADASLTILRPEFHMRNLDTLYAPPVGGSRAAAGFEVNF